jgi:CRP/FNR family transcriptional regulator, dissimilatory nitrate respiration regulator
MKTFAEFKQTVIANTLRSTQLFGGLSTADLSDIVSISLIKSLDKDEYLFHEGDPSQGFYVVQKGAVNIHRVNSMGKEQVIHIFREHESFAEATLATDCGYPADARAVEPSQVILVRKAEFLGLVRRQPDLAICMLGSISLHLRILICQIEDLTMKDVETRLANWLVQRCPDPRSEMPFSFDLGMTKRVLAAELGTVSETFSRTVAKFRDQHLLEVKGRNVTVRSPLKLSSLLRRNLGE